MPTHYFLFSKLRVQKPFFSLSFPLFSRYRAVQVRGFAEGELGRAKQYALSTAEVRIPLRNLLGKLPAQVGKGQGGGGACTARIFVFCLHMHTRVRILFSFSSVSSCIWSMERLAVGNTNIGLRSEKHIRKTFKVEVIAVRGYRV